MGVSVDAVPTLKAFEEQNPVHHVLLSDFRRTMLPAYGALDVDPQSSLFRYAKRAYFVIDPRGIVRYAKIMGNPLDVLTPAELLAAVKGGQP